MATPATRDSTPFILTSGTTALSIAVTAGVPGPPALLTSRDLINTLRNPIEITELHFVVTEDHALVVTPGGFAGAFELSLTMGNRQITRGFCPLGALDVRRDTDFFEGSAVTSPVVSNQIRWILPVPLIVAPNEGFGGQVRLSPNIAYAASTGPITFSMVARGRRLPVGTPVPRVRQIPYASGWIFTTANQPAPDQVFQNPFQVPLHIAAINGRLTVWDDGSGNAPPLPQGTAIITGPGGLANGVIRGIASGVPTTALFAQREAVEEPHILEPAEAYQFTFSNPAPVIGGVNTGLAVALTGWREE